MLKTSTSRCGIVEFNRLTAACRNFLVFGLWPSVFCFRFFDRFVPKVLNLILTGLQPVGGAGWTMVNRFNGLRSAAASHLENEVVCNRKTVETVIQRSGAYHRAESPVRMR
jgi:hypothetical protein